MAAFDPATLDRWRTLAIVDRDGTTVGTINEFFMDRETGHPTWALVNTGLFGASHTFVPLVHATEISDGLQVPYAKDHIKDAPRLDPGDELTPNDEATLFAHYGVDYSPAASDPTTGDLPPPDPGDTPSAEPEGAEAESNAVSAAGESGGLGEGSEVGAGSGVGAGSEAGSGAGEAPGPVPSDPGTADAGEATRTEAFEAGTAAQREDLAEPQPDLSRPEPSSDPSQPDPSQADLSRPAPVEPGLPGSTASTTSGPASTTSAVGAAVAPDDPEGQGPAEAGWVPGAARSSEEQQPVDSPPSSTDRWRDAKLAAEREQIAREAAGPQERSPLERARRRLERLVGGGQGPEEAEADAERDAAERERRARLGFDEDDPRR